MKNSKIYISIQQIKLKNMEEFANNNKERSLQSKNRTYSRELTTLQRDLQTSSLDTFSRRDDYGYGDDLEVFF